MDSLREKKPGNESETHWLLKCAGLYWLFIERSCRSLADEVYVKRKTGPDQHGQSGTKRYTDVMGIRHGNDDRRQIYSIECKKDRADFRNGFCVCEKAINFVMAPSGVIESDEMPAKVGLLEIDLDTLSITNGGPRSRSIGGVSVTKQSRTYEPDWKDQYTFYLEQIARRSTIGCLFGSSGSIQLQQEVA